MWVFGKRQRKLRREPGITSARRSPRPEALEKRFLLAAAPVHVGVVYLETDSLTSSEGQGADSLPDRFLVSFTGGAERTQLVSLQIETDKDLDGLTVGDPLFDSQLGGRGKGGAHPLNIVRLQVADARASVSGFANDGGTSLTLNFEHFYAGDTLEFSIDVDEVVRLSPSLEIFNSRLDEIVSGQEFQDSILRATFTAPHFEEAQGESIFLNDYGDPNADLGLDLPPDVGLDPDSLPNRSAAAVASLQQVPKPISISGIVFVDNDLDLIRDASEATISGVVVRLWELDASTGQYVDTGRAATTDAQGTYRFATDLGLLPGTYRVAQVQPAGYLSVGAIVGSVSGATNGSANGTDMLTGIELTKGDLHGVQYNFAEALPATLSGYVYQDLQNDGIRTSTDPGIEGIRIELVPIDTLAPMTSRISMTDAAGFYRFENLSPGTYRIVQLDQPTSLFDGLDTPGLVDGVPRGTAMNPGDEIRGIELFGASQGIEYNFGELPFGSLAGRVYLPAAGENCAGPWVIAPAPLTGVTVKLYDSSGTLLRETLTDAQGEYRFEKLPPGEYRIEEVTPEDLFDGKPHVGEIAGTAVGVGTLDGSIDRILLLPGQEGTQYNFCEIAPVIISGYVYHDRSNDGLRGLGEEGISEVTLRLLDEAGDFLTSTLTLADGSYEFPNLMPGTYQITQVTPRDYFDGLDRAGEVAGQNRGTAVNPGDRLEGIVLRQGEAGIEFNFGELRPASISGRVHADLNENCTLEPGELPLAGVLFGLLDGNGNEVAQTTSGSDGIYLFSQLMPGQYTVVQTQPAGYLSGGQKAGSTGGDRSVPNRISAIPVASGVSSIDNNFCERPLGSLAGSVFADRNQNAQFEAGEPLLVGVTLELLGSDGELIETTVTDSQGRYRFEGLPSGTYHLRERQPLGYFQGGQRIGSGGGQVLRDDWIEEVPLGWGQVLANYDFWEFEPASIAGRVWSEFGEDRIFGVGDAPLAAVTIELLNAEGAVQSVMQTAADGTYSFQNLRPGKYAVRQLQPSGLLEGGAVRGTEGGQVVGRNLIRVIDIAPARDLRGYNFYEFVPSIISGYVFRDGPVRTLDTPPNPVDLRLIQDGKKTADDVPLAGVVLELRNILGMPVDPRNTLPGSYPSGVVRAITNSEGYYEFPGLYGRTSYHVYQVQPAGFVDGIDTAGAATSGKSSAGIAANAADLGSDSQLAAIHASLSSNLETNPHYDAILLISPERGAHSQQNNFSELAIEPMRWAIVDPLLPPVFDPVVVIPEQFTGRNLAFTALRPDTRDGMFIGSWGRDVSWHLSIINGGAPRGAGLVGGVLLRTISKESSKPWFAGETNLGRWRTFDEDGKESEFGKAFQVGVRRGLPLVGDFNGDGRDEIGIFIGGQWLVDLNANGQWDEGDLWIRLGSPLDKPVVGDWDGDGKADVGIFGPQWARDEEAIPREPGLPDPDNQRLRGRKNVPPQELDATSGRRLLQKSVQGSVRADVIDHVFSYGEPADLPLVGDWNGDGIDAIAVFRAGNWKLDLDGDGRWTERDGLFSFGQPGDLPVVGDFNGDGLDELAIVRGDLWIIDSDGDRRLTDADTRISIPRRSDEVPVVGDWDGDGRAEPGLYQLPPAQNDSQEDAA